MAHLFMASEHMHDAAPSCIFNEQKEGEAVE